MNWSAEDLKAHYARLVKVGECGLINPDLSPGIDPQVTGPARGRLPVPKGMNRTEQAYAQYLEGLYLSREILWWGFEAIKVRIGHNSWFSPDFLIMYPDHRLECHDTKSARGGAKYFAEDDAIAKARAMGKTFPIPVFFVWKQKDGSWATREM